MSKKGKPAFEDDLTRLQEIVALLEEGPETLDATLALFEEGMALTRRLEETLAEAETKVKQLFRDAGGNLGVADEEAGGE